MTISKHFDSTADVMVAQLGAVLREKLNVEIAVIQVEAEHRISNLLNTFRDEVLANSKITMTKNAVDGGMAMTMDVKFPPKLMKDIQKGPRRCE